MVCRFSAGKVDFKVLPVDFYAAELYRRTQQQERFIPVACTSIGKLIERGREPTAISLLLSGTRDKVAEN